MTSSSVATSPSYVALVGDRTPAHLEFGDYRGWVELDETAGYVQDLTAEQVAAKSVEWVTFPAEYERLGLVTTD